MTDKTQHTPGPWMRGATGTPDWAKQYLVYTEAGRDIALVYDGDNAEANASLVAAAPDLLAAALDTVAAWDHENGGGPVVVPPHILALRDAIRQAKGI